MKFKLTSLETVAMTALLMSLAIAVAVTSCPDNDSASRAQRHTAAADSVMTVIAKEAVVHSDTVKTKKKGTKPKASPKSKATSRNHLDEPVNQ